MAQAISVPYTILSDSGITESQEPRQPQARVRFKCAAGDHYQLIKDVVGTSTAVTDWTIGNIERVFPLPYPPSPNLIGRAVESVEFKGPATRIPGVPLPWFWRKYAYVTIRFELALFNDGEGNGQQDISGQPFTSTTFNTSGDSMSLPGSVLKFPRGAPNKTAAAGIVIPQAEIQMTRHLMPFIPLPQMLALQGKVNAAPIQFLNMAIDVGHVLFVGGSTQITCDTLGNLMWDVTYNMVYRALPWNMFFSPTPGEGWAIPLDQAGNPVYQPGDFSILP